MGILVLLTELLVLRSLSANLIATTILCANISKLKKPYSTLLEYYLTIDDLIVGQFLLSVAAYKL